MDQLAAFIKLSLEGHRVRSHPPFVLAEGGELLLGTALGCDRLFPLGHQRRRLLRFLFEERVQLRCLRLLRRQRRRRVLGGGGGGARLL